jgi:hypothetical protein
MDNHADNFIISTNYIAGLVDSDFGVYISRFYPRGKLRLSPCIQFVNTNFGLIELCHKYLDDNDINHHIRFRKATVGKDKKELTINRLIKCIEFADLVVGCSVVRKPQLEIIREFCVDRLHYVYECGWKQNNTPYTDYQKKLYDELLNLNLNYNYDNGNRNYTASWLAGMIDGDGSVCFVVTENKKSEYELVNGDIREYYHTRVIPTIDITTGSDTNRNNIITIFDNLDIKYSIRTTKSKAKKRLGKNKKKYYYNLYIRSYDDIEKFLLYVKDKLYAKRRQAILMLEYLELKKNNKFNTDEVFDIVNKVKFLNNNPNNKDISETTR